MILGQAITTLDNGKRIAIPAKFRRYFQNDESIIISPGFEGCLVIHNLKEFGKWQDKILQQSEGLKESRILLRQVFANSEKLVIDKKVRITIPPSLLTLADIKQKVIIIGMINKLEVWAEERWEDFNKETKNRLEVLVEERWDDKETKNQLEEVAVTLKEF